MPSDSEIRERIDSISDEKYRNAFKYQYLIAGRIAEVCGRYAPKGDDVFPVDFDGELAALFVVKTAKRKGKLRAVALPLNTEYEPWADDIRLYFTQHKNEYPFKFADNWKTSIRYAQWEAEKAFKDLEWPMAEYTKAMEIKVNESQILDRGINMRNQDVYKIHFEDEKKAKWYTVIDNLVVNKPIKVYDRWKPMTSHVLRKRRTITLYNDYDFDPFDLAAYGGWTEKSQVDAMPGALKFYLHMDIQSVKDNLGTLKKMARRYFKKLCKPYVE